MLGNKNALVILWTGNNIPDYLIGKIGEVLVTNGITIPEMLRVIYKDQDGLAQCLIRESNGKSTIKIDVNDDIAEALKQAIVYIGKRFEASLVNANKGNLITFAIELQSALSKAHNNVGFNFLGVDENDKALINAVKLIATTDAVIPSSLAKKYHFTKDVCNVIKQIHNQFTLTMCHGQIKSSKTVRFKKDEGHHKNAVPYKRADKHKSDWFDDSRYF